MKVEREAKNQISILNFNIFLIKNCKYATPENLQNINDFFFQ